MTAKLRQKTPETDGVARCQTARRPLAALVLVALAAPRAGADDEVAGPAPVRVVAEVDAGGEAHLVARFELELPGPALDHGAAELALPRRAVVTAATATIDGVAHPLALVRAGEASSALDDLAARPGGLDRAAALVLSGGGSSGSAELDVALPRATHVAL